MTSALSPRLRRVVDALPLSTGVRVLEIGGAPGAAAREVAHRIEASGHVLVLDRSHTGIEATRRACAEEISAGVLTTLCAPVEDFALPEDVEPFDIAFACRVGALDGRHPKLYDAALRNVRKALTAKGALYIDTGDPLRQLPLG